MRELRFNSSCNFAYEKGTGTFSKELSHKQLVFDKDGFLLYLDLSTPLNLIVIMDIFGLTTVPDLRHPTLIPYPPWKAKNESIHPRHLKHIN